MLTSASRGPVRARAMGSGWLASLVLVSFACARNARLDERVNDVALSLGKVEAQGAMRCAPRELAIARSHLEFAQLEREQGFADRALQHLDVAAESVRAASVLVEPASCVDAR